MTSVFVIGVALLVGQVTEFSLKQTRKIEQACEAFARGQSLAVIERLAPIVNRCSDDQLTQLDGMLLKRKFPNAGEMLATARLSFVQRGLEKHIPPGGRARNDAGALRDRETGTAQAHFADERTRSST